MPDLTELQRLAEGATPGEWHACKDGACSCAMVWCADYPVATVTRGKWGDTFPSLRLVGDSSIGRQVEPYTEMIEYGEVSEKLASANAAFIAAMNPDTAKKLIAVALAAEMLYADTLDYIRVNNLGDPNNYGMRAVHTALEELK